MFTGLLKPLAVVAGLTNPADASDPMNSAMGLVDTATVASFLAEGAEVVGGLGDGVNFDSILPTPAPEMAPAPAPTIQVAAAPMEPTFGLNGGPV